MEQEPESRPPVFRFQMRCVSRPDDSYYVTRWDKAIPLSVLAGNQKEADQKAFAMLGELKHGAHWVLATDRIDEEA